VATRRCYEEPTALTRRSGELLVDDGRPRPDASVARRDSGPLGAHDDDVTTTTLPRGSVRKRAVMIVAVTVVLVALLTYAAGVRLNVATRAVPVPGADASADQVVLAYVDAYDARDFSTLRAIYPSQVPSRFGVLGTFRDLEIIESHASSALDLAGRERHRGRQYWTVRVTLTITDLGGSDLAYSEGPNGWNYWLERSDAQHRWRIVDHGNG
jgi:hypothetical protein